MCYNIVMEQGRWFIDMNCGRRTLLRKGMESGSRKFEAWDSSFDCNFNFAVISLFLIALLRRHTFYPECMPPRFLSLLLQWLWKTLEWGTNAPVRNLFPIGDGSGNMLDRTEKTRYNDNGYVGAIYPFWGSKNVQGCTNRKDFFMKQILKKTIAAVCASAAVVQMLPFAVFAAEPAPVRVLAVGDDCLADTEGVDAVDYVAEYLGGVAVNRAEIGQKASGLVEKLKNDASLQTDIKSADVILVSIGMNDLISPILYENTDLIDASKYTTLKDLANGLSRESALLMDERLSRIMPNVVASANQAVQNAVASIHRQNPAANIIVQAIPNPLAVDFSKVGVNQNRAMALSEMFLYLENCLDGGTTSGGTTIATGVNQTIAALPNVQISDFTAPYVGASGEQAMGFVLSNITNLNMTFTPVGQVVIAAAAVRADPQLTNGDGSVLATAYENTQVSLADERKALDTMIQLASSNTVTRTYALGDIDGDTIHGINDAFLTLTEVSMASAGADTTFSPALRRAADADGNDQLTINDAFLWLMYSSNVSAGNDIDLETFLKENGRV